MGGAVAKDGVWGSSPVEMGAWGVAFILSGVWGALTCLFRDWGVAVDGGLPTIKAGVSSIAVVVKGD